MSFFSEVIDFFESIFMASNPAVKKKQALKKIESELKNNRNGIFSNGMIEPNFAEVLRIMYHASKPILKILDNTICSDDITRNDRFEEQLLLTGFDDEAQQILESLEYENRKKGAREAPNVSRYFESERRQLEKVINLMNSQDFGAIEDVIDVIRQIYDVCNYKYLTALRIFDINFSTSPDYEPSFQAVPAELVETSLNELYFVLAGINITRSVANAILALGELLTGQKLSDRSSREVMDALKKLQTVRRQVLTNEVLLGLLRVAKKNPELMPERAVYKAKTRQKYAKYLQEKFVTDEKRMKSELQDETIVSEVRNLFAGYELPKVNGYNADMNNQLKQSSTTSFEWILPYQVLKGFVRYYYEERIKPLLNDIVIEGFFSNPTYKTDFSQVVYATNDTLSRLEEFEKKFERGGPFDEALLTGFIRDSHKDNSFVLKLKEQVEIINKSAKDLIQKECATINHLNRIVTELIIESKKPTSESISNLRVLMMSSRNRDNYEAMERQHPQWIIFLEIMKNYVIIGNIDKQ